MLHTSPRAPACHTARRAGTRAAVAARRRGRCCAAAAQQTRTATVSVDVGYAEEQCTVPLSQPGSRLLSASMRFPLGLVLENVDGQAAVVEVAEGGAAAAAGCRVGDVVRATTCFTMQMTYPTMNLMFGGVGRPKLTKMLLPTASVPFSKVLDAVRSCSEAQGGDGLITLVLERAGDASSSSSGDGANGSANSSSTNGSSSNGGSGGAPEGREGEEGSAFDPRLFE